MFTPAYLYIRHILYRSKPDWNINKMDRIIAAVQKLIDRLLGPGGSPFITVVVRDTLLLMGSVIVLLLFYRFLEAVVPAEHRQLRAFFAYAHQGAIYIGVLAIIVRWVKWLYKWITKE